jgi:hypothetical protein
MPNATLMAGAPQKSVVADFEESVPQLWEALTDGEDLQGRWQKLTFPEDAAVQLPTRKLEDVGSTDDEARSDPPPARDQFYEA